MTYKPYSSLTASGVSDDRVNNSGSSIFKGTPVRINSSGELDIIDVSVESSITNVVGVAAADILNTLKGATVNSGKIENITTSADFGDTIYISKTGSITNIKPDVGVSGFIIGDFVVMVGVIAKNEATPANKDLIINITIIGQL